MSWMRYLTLYSFRKLNPDWQIDLYYSDNLLTNYNSDWDKAGHHHDFNNFIGVDYFQKIKELDINLLKWNTNEDNLEYFNNITPSGKSNMFKWHQLYKYGGIYADMDILFIKPIDELFNNLNKNNTNVAICQTGYLSIGFMASTPNNQFFKDIFDNCFNFSRHIEYQQYGVSNVYNLYGNKSKNILPVAIQKYPDLNFFNLEMNLFYPFNHRLVNDCFAKESTINFSDFPNNSIGYHWYGGSAIAQKYNNILNEDNYMDYNNLFCKTYKNVFKT